MVWYAQKRLNQCVFASTSKVLMENGGKEKQFFASQTIKTSVNGGKGWQIYASVFSKTKNLDAKTKKQKRKPASRKTEMIIIDGKVY